MAKVKGASLASIFDDEPAEAPPAAARPAETRVTAPRIAQEPAGAGEGASASPRAPKRTTGQPRAAERPSSPATSVKPASTRRDSHPGKKPVLIHIPEDMHRTLRQLSVEEGGEPITKVVERSLRDYLVRRGHTRYAAT